MTPAAPARAEQGARSWVLAGPLVLARQLDAADCGTYKQLFLVFQLMTLQLPFGMAQGLYFLLPREPHAARACLGQSLVWLMGTALLSAAAWWVLAEPVAGRFNSLAVPVCAGLGLRGAMGACAAHGLARGGAAWWTWLRAEGVALATFPLDGALRARAQTRFLFVSCLGKALVTVPLLWGGVRWLGMVGAISGWLVAEVLGKVSLMWRLPAALSTASGRCRLRSLVPGRELAGAGGGGGRPAR
ncbi:MAG: hypothetical protein FJ086_16600, partial [Deltaproteobacteria bacterium]|nr:hypothetical protein [Deltaproteobacteria bacterium]